MAEAGECLAKGIDINTRAFQFGREGMPLWTEGMSALHYAAAKGKNKMAAFLLAKGAAVNMRGGWLGAPFQTPLDLALEHGHEDTARLLREHGAISLTELMEADADKGRSLIKSSTDPNCLDAYKRTLLHWAAERGVADVAAALIERGVDVNARDWLDRTPLHFATREGHEAVALLLMGNEADANATDTRGRTPLYWAATCGNVAIIKALLAKNADPNIKPFADRTPLECAEWQHHGEAAALLLKHGAKRSKDLRERH